MQYTYSVFSNLFKFYKADIVVDTIVLISILLRLLRFTEFIVMISAANNVSIGASLKFSKYNNSLNLI